MRWLKLFFAFVLLVVAAGASAGGGHGHFHRSGARVGVYIGGPLFWPGYAYPPPYSYYYSPPMVMAPSTPTYYIEKGQEPLESQPASEANYWHYCSDPDGYYPYIKQCRSGWQRVSPQPPTQQ